MAVVSPFNFPHALTGAALVAGNTLVIKPATDTTWIVGMKMFQDFGKRNYVRPIILELGGKNPVIVSKIADLELATVGIIRSAFGLQGQKCSTASRVLVADSVYDELVGRLKEAADTLGIGDPTERATPSALHA